MEKGRYKDRDQVRLYPLSRFNSWCARPLSAMFAGWATPNQVSVLSLAVSLAGLVLVASAQWDLMALGAGLVHVGLLLDHADGQVARRQGTGSTLGMYIDMVFDRIVEIAMIVALIPALAAGISEAPIEPVWSVEPWLATWLAMLALGTMMLWRFLNAYNDVLYLRSHILETGQVPSPAARPKKLLKRPLIPWVFNRDWVLAIWALGVLTAQIHAMVVLLLVLHTLVSIEKVLVFRARHQDPEGDAARVLGKDYH